MSSVTAVRTLRATVCAALLTVAAACGGEPNSLFDKAGYHVRDGVVYYLEAFPGDASEIEEADPETFEALDGTYATDKNAVYQDGVPLPDADPATFELLEKPNYSKDAEHVFLRGQVLTEDVAHFTFLATGGLTADSRYVYWSDGSVLSEDPAGFEIISHEDHYLFTQDSSTVYVQGTAVEEADPATFEVLGGAYSQDADDIFYFTDPVPEIDATTFELLEAPYARDGERAYWMGTVVPGADPSTFEVLNADFECTADDERAYYRDRVIEGFDPATIPDTATVTNCSETFVGFS